MLLFAVGNSETVLGLAKHTRRLLADAGAAVLPPHFFEASQLRSPTGTISNLSHFSLVANYAYCTLQAYHYTRTA